MTFAERRHLGPLDTDARSIGITRNWWALGARGAAALVFGAVALVLPGSALTLLALAFCAYLVTDGIFAILTGVRAARRDERWWSFVIEGTVDIAVAAAALMLPGLTVVMFIALTSGWAVLSGVLMLVASRRLSERRGRWALLAGGMLSLLWGVMLITAPLAGAIVLAWWMGFYAVLFGITLVSLAWRLRRERPSAAPVTAAGVA